MDQESRSLATTDRTTRSLLFVLYVIVTGAITGIIFWAVGQAGLWTSVVALFVVSYIVIWGLVVAEQKGG